MSIYTKEDHTSSCQCLGYHFSLLSPQSPITKDKIQHLISETL